MVYSFELDTCFTGEEMAYSQGWPAGPGMKKLQPDITNFSSSKLTQLAGNAVSLPVMGTVTAAMFYNPHAPWWTPRPDSELP